MAQYWNEELTAASWSALLEFSKAYDCTVIGGWAVYLWARTQKSKDLDLAVGYAALDGMRSAYRVDKNDRLKKYEIKMEKFDVDLYLPHYSKLALPIEEVIAGAVKIGGIKAASAESLLVLKQGAQIDRKGTVKGRKDTIDLLSLLLRSPIDLAKYGQLLKTHGLEGYRRELFFALSDFDERDCAYLGMNFKEFAGWRRGKKEELKKTYSE
ncbi:MAG: hypothetical protein V1708_03995 [Candidatus Micrarchaeota archaeon]